MTLADAIEYFVADRWGSTAAAKVHRARARFIRSTELGALMLAKVTTSALQSYCDDRLASISAATVKEEARLVRMSIEHARRQWGMSLPKNPGLLLELPPIVRRRRQVEPDELKRLYEALSHRPRIRALLELSIETGMSRRELLALDWTDLDLDGAMANLRATKDLKARSVPLSARAVEIFRGLDAPHYRVFHISVARIRWAFEVACRKADLKDLRLYDLRRSTRRQTSLTVAGGVVR